MGDVIGIYDFRDRKKNSSSNKRKKRFCPEYWGIDLVMSLICIAITVLAIVYRKEIMIYFANILVNIAPIFIILIIFIAVLVGVLAIRNKRRW